MMPKKMISRHAEFVVAVACIWMLPALHLSKHDHFAEAFVSTPGSPQRRIYKDTSSFARLETRNYSGKKGFSTPASSNTKKSPSTTGKKQKKNRNNALKGSSSSRDATTTFQQEPRSPTAAEPLEPPSITNATTNATSTTATTPQKDPNKTREAIKDTTTASSSNTTMTTLTLLVEQQQEKISAIEKERDELKVVLRYLEERRSETEADTFVRLETKLRKVFNSEKETVEKERDDAMRQLNKTRVSLDAVSTKRDSVARELAEYKDNEAKREQTVDESNTSSEATSKLETEALQKERDDAVRLLNTTRDALDAVSNDRDFVTQELAEYKAKQTKWRETVEEWNATSTAAHHHDMEALEKERDDALTLLNTTRVTLEDVSKERDVFAQELAEYKDKQELEESKLDKTVDESGAVAETNQHGTEILDYDATGEPNTAKIAQEFVSTEEDTGAQELSEYEDKQEPEASNPDETIDESNDATETTLHGTVLDGVVLYFDQGEQNRARVAMWNEMCQQLWSFKEDNGYIAVPHDLKGPLAEVYLWTATQRKRYALTLDPNAENERGLGRLTEEEYVKLRRLGFDFEWEPKVRQAMDRHWEIMFGELEKHKNSGGDVNRVRQWENDGEIKKLNPLFAWLGSQHEGHRVLHDKHYRSFHGRKAMTNEQESRLRALGVQFRDFYY